MAGAGYKSFSSGDVLTASDVNTYLMQQTVMVFADATARDSAISSPSEGMLAFLKSDNSIYFYDGSSWGAYIGAGDITGVTITTSATSGLSGGASATSGAFSSTLLVAPTQATSGTVASADVILFADADDSNNLKKTTAGDIAGLASGVSLGLVIALS